MSWVDDIPSTVGSFDTFKGSAATPTIHRGAGSSARFPLWLHIANCPGSHQRSTGRRLLVPHRLKPHRHDLRRLFIVEPGLSSLAGHPVECVLSLQAAADSLGIVPHVLSPQAAPPEVLSGIRSVHRFLAAPCFPITEDGPLKF